MSEAANTRKSYLSAGGEVEVAGSKVPKYTY